MVPYTDSDLLQLEAKLRNEVSRLHPDTPGHKGMMELVNSEAEILLGLVQAARGTGSTSGDQGGSML